MNDAYSYLLWLSPLGVLVFASQNSACFGTHIQVL